MIFRKLIIFRTEISISVMPRDCKSPVGQILCLGLVYIRNLKTYTIKILLLIHGTGFTLKPYIKMPWYYLILIQRVFQDQDGNICKKKVSMAIHFNGHMNNRKI